MNSTSRKIILLHYAAPPVVGGVESVLGHHARLMADDGHKVKIVAGRGAQTDERIPFISLPLADSRHQEILSVKEKLDAGHVPDQFGELTISLADDLEKISKGVDYLIAHNVCSLAKNLPLTSALKTLSEQQGKPQLILWHHDLAWTTPRYRAELHDGYPWDLLRTDWKGAKQVVVSQLRQQELAKLINVPLERIHIVPNGVEMSRFMKLETVTRTFLKQLNLLAAKPILLLPVRITPRKNIELAIRTIAVLRESYSRAVLVVTGPLGPHNPANIKYFEKLVEMRAELDLGGAVYFLTELSEEYLPDEVIADFYKLADALFMPSREEGFGIPILEAGISGLPVFCTHIPPLQELGGDQATYFSPDDDPGEVARLIIDRLDRERTYKMRERVRAAYTWEQVYAEAISPLLETGEL